MSDKIRVLVCKTCGTAQELPWYEGDIRGDIWLNNAVENHPKFGDGRPHMAGGLFNIPVEGLWDSPARRQVTLQDLYKQLEIPGTGPGMGQEFYDLKSNFVDDAFECWKKHNRTTDPAHCDYMKESMRVYPDTKADRRAEGLPSERPATYICSFCPLNSIVEQKKRKKKGLYK